MNADVYYYYVRYMTFFQSKKGKMPSDMAVEVVGITIVP